MAAPPHVNGNPVSSVARIARFGATRVHSGRGAISWPKQGSRNPSGLSRMSVFSPDDRRSRQICVFLPIQAVPGQKNLATRGHGSYLTPCPISHVPVAACRLVGIRTRGRTAARSLRVDRRKVGNLRWRPRFRPDSNIKPAAGGETGEPRSPRGTQLKATTERAFLVSPTLQRLAPKRLVHHCRACGPGTPQFEPRQHGR